MKVEPFGPLDPSLYREIVRRALAEDMRWGDITTEATIPAPMTGRAACPSASRSWAGRATMRA